MYCRSAKSRITAVMLALVLAMLMAIVALATPQRAQATTYAGADRFETAALQAMAAYPDGCDTVLVVGSDAWPDALSCSSLAGVLDAPILYCSKFSVPQATADAIKKLGAKNAVVIGGANCVSDRTLTRIKDAAGLDDVQRIAGKDRFDTQRKIYEYGAEGLDGQNHWSTGHAIVVSGANFPDALCISPYAFKTKTPIFLVSPGGNLPTASKKLMQNDSIRWALIVGGTAVVSNATEQALNTICAESAAALNSAASEEADGGSNAKTVEPYVGRIKGSDRYDTSIKVARWCQNAGVLGWNNCAIASATSPFDALAGSVLQGKRGAALLLVSNLGSSTLKSIAWHASGADTEGSHPELGRVYTFDVFGGPAAIPNYVVTELACAVDPNGFGAFDRLKCLSALTDAGNKYSRLSTFNTDYVPSPQALQMIYDGVEGIRSRGYDVGFIMMDINARGGVTFNADTKFFSASSVKGPYVASLCKYWPNALEPYRYNIEQTIRLSSNEHYMVLRGAFGGDTMQMFIDDAGVTGLSGYQNYVWYSPRMLSKLWIEIYDYFEGASQNYLSEWCRSLYGKGNGNYRKIGWQHIEAASRGLNPALVYAGVRKRDDHHFVYALLTNCCDDDGQAHLDQIEEGLKLMHREMTL